MAARTAVLACGLLAAAVSAFPSGVDSCENAPQHGTSLSSVATFAVTMLDSAGAVVLPSRGWVPGATYTFKLAPAGGGTTPAFTGFVAGVFVGTPTSFSSAKSPLAAVSAGSTRAMGSCSGGLTHTNNNAKSQVSFRWTAPASGSSTFTFRAIVVRSYGAAYSVLNVAVPPALPTASGSPASTSSAAATRSRSSAPTPSRSAAASASGTMSGTAARTVSPSQTASAAATASASLSPGASPSGTASGTAATSTTNSPSASGSASASWLPPSSSPSPSGSAPAASATVAPSTLRTRVTTATRSRTRARLTRSPLRRASPTRKSKGGDGHGHDGDDDGVSEHDGSSTHH